MTPQNFAKLSREKMAAELRRLVPADLVSTAVFLPPGDHDLELRYVPLRLYQGAGVSAVALVTLLAWGWLPRRRSAGLTANVVSE